MTSQAKAFLSYPVVQGNVKSDLSLMPRLSLPCSVGVMWAGYRDPSQRPDSVPVSVSLWMNFLTSLPAFTIRENAIALSG